MADLDQTFQCSVVPTLQRRKGQPPALDLQSPHAFNSSEPSRRSSNHVVVHPASPEVISSLIETLSAISTPVEEYFDTSCTSAIDKCVSPSTTSTSAVIRSTSSIPNSPSPLSTHFSKLHEWDRSECATNRLPDSIRSMQNEQLPSGQIVAPRSKKKTGSQYLAPESKLSTSFTHHNAPLGAPSILRAEQIRTITDPIAHRRGLKSFRSLKSLRIRNSSESLTTPSRTPVLKKDRIFISDTQSSPTESIKPVRDTVLSELLGQTQSKDIKLDVAGGLKSPFLHKPIPRRASSKRHSVNFPGNTNVAQESSQGEHKCEIIKGKKDRGLQIVPSDIDSDLLALEDNEVTRRISELRAQKVKRDQTLTKESSPDDEALVQTPVKTERSLSQKGSSTEHKAESPLLAVKSPPAQVHVTLTSHESIVSPGESLAHSSTITPKTEHNSGDLGETSQSALHQTHQSRDDIRTSSLPLLGTRGLQKRRSMHSTTSTDKSRRRVSASINIMQPKSRSTNSPSLVAQARDLVESYLDSPRLSQKIQHPRDGRIICFSEVGDPNGSVVFCCVGMGLTRFITTFYEELASTLHLRLITPDRPGVGGSEVHAHGDDTPLNWPDDVRLICEHRGITKFSILAHSAGAIYALATTLRMSQHMRCRVHLLAPWIPPSQMSPVGHHQEPLPSSAMPVSQRFLRSLPTTFFRAANSNFFSLTSERITTSLPRTPNRNKASTAKTTLSSTPTNKEGAYDEGDKNSSPKGFMDSAKHDQHSQSTCTSDKRSDSLECTPQSPLDDSANAKAAATWQEEQAPRLKLIGETSEIAPSVNLESSYEAQLATSIWDRATSNANPAVDLLVCLERRRPIGFRYADITRNVVIHHGSKDTRVPVDNIKWLAKTMRRCEVRVLEGEGHGLMASAQIMSEILMEIAREWDDWNQVVKGQNASNRQRAT